MAVFLPKNHIKVKYVILVRFEYGRMLCVILQIIDNKGFVFYVWLLFH